MNDKQKNRPNSTTQPNDLSEEKLQDVVGGADEKEPISKFEIDDQVIVTLAFGEFDGKIINKKYYPNGGWNYIIQTRYMTNVPAWEGKIRLKS